MTVRPARAGRVAGLEARAYRVPTDRAEADGTLVWQATTVVVVQASADDGETGLGFSYSAAAAAPLVGELLAEHVIGGDVEAPTSAWQPMIDAVRNVGLAGVAAGAISAVDVALWDLHARSVGQSLHRRLGARRESVPIYGSGGFTTYSSEELAEQLGSWVEAGIPRVKIKVGVDHGTRPDEDVRRVAAARDAIGERAELFVDANGAYTAKQAIAQAEAFAESGVSYFEEPVSSDRLDQLALVRDAAPMAIAAGEYAYAPWHFERLLSAGAVDILQADVTRCLGVTGFLIAADLAYAAGVPLSAHTAPAIHAHVGCAVPAIAHVEYFHDHARLEPMLFDGVPTPEGGTLAPDPARPGLGLELSGRAAQWQVWP